MTVVGLTGNLASGKSEAAQVFKKLGAKIIDADALAKKLIQKGTPLYKAMLKIFGRGFLDKNKDFDRRKLAWHVFTHPRKLKKLNTLIHPGVILEVYKAIEKEKDKKGLLVLDVPLLFESRMEKIVDTTVVVSSSQKALLARAAKKGVPAGLAKKILASQWPLPKKEKKADCVIENNGTLAELKIQVKKVYDRIIQNEKFKM